MAPEHPGQHLAAVRRVAEVLEAAELRRYPMSPLGWRDFTETAREVMDAVTASPAAQAPPEPLRQDARGADRCPRSRRDDGQHSWLLDGDDPYIRCAFCEEMRDALTGRIVKAAATGAGEDGGDD